MTHKFLPALDVAEVRNKNKRAWRYGTIRAAAAPLPVSFMNTDGVVQRDQDQRGTCVGQSTASFMDYLHILGCGEQQTGEVIRDLIDENGNRHDQLPKQAMSAECIYTFAQQKENINTDDGAYVHDAVQMAKDKGICLESQWYTCKGEGQRYTLPYPATQQEVDETCAKHHLDGYASITSLQELKQALVAKKVVVGAINVYDSYGNDGVLPNGLHSGHFPDPSPGDTVIGGHALCYIGYDDTKKLLYFRHSWAGWESVGSISYDYWNSFGSDFWCGIDVHEVAIGQEMYIPVHVMGASGATVTITYGDKLITKGIVPYDINLIVGKQYKIIMTTLDGQVASKVVMVDDSTTFINVALETPDEDWLASLGTFIKRILGI